jgi:hypothetical protein
MNNDDSRGNQNYQHRKPSPYKNSYSPNSVYYGNSNHNNQQPQQQQKKKHFSGGHNKGSNNNDRLMKQNDTIIRLLKEIRDRLPAPAGAVVNENGEDFNQRSNLQAERHSEHHDNDAVEVDCDENEDSFDNADEDSFEVENERD